MALDGAFLFAVKKELTPLIGGRVEKIHQPSREEILISIRTMAGQQKNIHISKCRKCKSPHYGKKC